jgi:hypothetical protein
MSVKVAEKITIMNLDLQISETYHNLAEAFNSPEADRLLSHCEDDLEIDLKSDMKSFFEPVYKLSENECESLHKYLNSSLVSGFIQSS